MSLAPIVLFVYNRLDHAIKTIEALKKNDLAKESELFIFSDAPKNEGAEKAVAEVRDFLETVDGFKKVTINKKDRNWGLANSIVDGVTGLVNEYGKIIVMEDDIVTSPFFLRYMNDALNLYENDEKVMHVSGYTFPVDTSQFPETFFYEQASCWGWATWSRAWKYFSTDTKYLLNGIKNSKRGEYYKIVSSQLRANLDGRIKTWAAKWQAAVYMNDGLCLHPKISLVNNVGHDGSGIHSNKNNVFNNIVMAKGVKLKRIPIEELEVINKVMDNFYRSIRPSKFEILKSYLRGYYKKLKSRL